MNKISLNIENCFLATYTQCTNKIVYKIKLTGIWTKVSCENIGVTF